MILDRQDFDFLENFNEDFAFLEKQMSEEAEKADIKHAAVVLRRFLIEDFIIKAWRMLALAPKQPMVEAYAFPANFYNEVNADVSWAGGAITSGIKVFGVRYANKRLTDDEVRKLSSEMGRNEKEIPMTLHDFKQSTAVYTEGVRVSRQQLVAYVANKRGGVHLDQVRKKDDVAYKVLDNVDATKLWVGENRLPPSSHGMLSIGQTLLGSRDLLNLRKFTFEACSQRAD